MPLRHQFTKILVPLTLGLALQASWGQTPREQAEKELVRKVPAGSIQACTLITRADVHKATGRDPYADPEPAGQGGWICNVGIAELKVYSGPRSHEAWEATMRGFKVDKLTRRPASGFGEGAYFIFYDVNNRNVDNVGILVAKSGQHTLALSVDAPAGKPAETARPALEALMKTVLSRLR